MLLLGADTNTETKRKLQNFIGYANQSDAKIRSYHESYAKLLSKYEAIISRSREVMKQREGKRISESTADYEPLQHGHNERKKQGAIKISSDHQGIL